MQAFAGVVSICDLDPKKLEDCAKELTLPGTIAHETAVKEHVWLDVPHF